MCLSKIGGGMRQTPVPGGQMAKGGVANSNWQLAIGKPRNLTTDGTDLTDFH
jgi:hypothetical protein